MAKNDAIRIRYEIEQKYGGMIGIMKASLENKLDPNDWKDYLEADNALNGKV